MIQIYIQQKLMGTSLIVEGKLACPWVHELENCWRKTVATAPHQPIQVNLANVIFIDDKGRELLKQMFQQGVQLQASGVMTRAIVEEITKEN